MSEKETRDDTTMVDDYQPLSVVGLIMLLIGISAAILGLINPNLAMIPLLAAIGIILFLVKVHLDKNESGRRMIVAAIVISLFAASAAMTYRTVRLGYLKVEAEKFAIEWINLVADGNLHDSFQLSTWARMREPEGTDLAAVFKNSSEAAKMLSDYAELEPEATIRRLGPSAVDFECVGCQIYEPSPHQTECFVIRFKMTRHQHEPGIGGGDRTFDITMQRQKDNPPLNVHWHVRTVRNIDPEIPRDPNPEQPGMGSR